jgi:pRiA4b ORF-3-like protein
MAVRQLRNIYQIKVTLNGVKPPIWRRLLISSSMTLGDLHEALQFAMGWTNSHLHQFISGGTYYGIQDDDLDFGVEIEDEWKYKVSQLLKSEKDSLIYEYDFGDGWEHQVLLEKILPFDKATVLPQCIKGKRSCPPEDCGGIWGYAELLKIIHDPENPEHESMLEWLGDEFESEAFNLNEVNELLAEYCR